VADDEVHQAFLDVGPDRGAGARLGQGAGGGTREVDVFRRRAGQVGQVRDRDHDVDLQFLGDVRAHRDDGTTALLRRAVAGEEVGDHLGGPDGGGQADALGRFGEERVETFQRDREVGPSLGAGDGVYLVQDHRPHPPQARASARGEDEVERLRRGDKDVRRPGAEGAALGRRGVARAGSDADLRQGEAGPRGGVADADQRGAQVPLDVGGEGLEGGDVEHAAPLGGRGERLGEQAVDRPEERGEGLARAGRRDHEGVAAARDGVPRARLRGGRRRERPGEPRARGGGEARQRVVVSAGVRAVVGHRVP